MPEESSDKEVAVSSGSQLISLPRRPGAESVAGVGGGGLMSQETAEERRQKFLFISRRTTTTVFAKHDEHDDDSRTVGDAVVPRQVLRRRQFSCQHYPEPPVETHFEWRRQNGDEKEKTTAAVAAGRRRSKDDMSSVIAGPAARQNKIRLKIVW